MMKYVHVVKLLQTGGMNQVRSWEKLQYVNGCVCVCVCVSEWQGVKWKGQLVKSSRKACLECLRESHEKMGEGSTTQKATICSQGMGSRIFILFTSQRTAQWWLWRRRHPPQKMLSSCEYCHLWVLHTHRMCSKLYSNLYGLVCIQL